MSSFHRYNLQQVLNALSRRLENPDEFLEGLYRIVPQEIMLNLNSSVVNAGLVGIPFDSSGGNCVNAIAAFSIEDVRAFQAENRDQTCVLFTDDNIEALEALFTFKNIAIGILENCPDHFPMHAKMNGDVSYLVLNNKKGDFIWDKKAGRLGNKNLGIVIERGDDVTIDTNNSLLYNAKLLLNKPEIPEHYEDFLGYIDSQSKAYDMGISYQVNPAEGCARCDKAIGLDRIENYFLPGTDGYGIFWRALREPKDSAHDELADYMERCVGSLLENASIELYTARFMDLQDDQMCRNEAEREELRSLLDLEKDEDLRGIPKRDDISEAQVRGLLRATEKHLAKDSVLCLSIPHANSVACIDKAKKIIEKAKSSCHSEREVVTGCFIEGVDVLDNIGSPQPEGKDLRSILERLASREINPSDATLRMSIGGRDLRKARMNGKDALVRERANPYKRIDTAMHKDLKTIIETVNAFQADTGRKVEISFCGPQLYDLYTALAVRDTMGIRLCIPPGTVAHALKLQALQNIKSFGVQPQSYRSPRIPTYG